jgi:hypothetical protein
MIAIGFGKKNIRVRWSLRDEYSKVCDWQNLQFYLTQNLVFPYLVEIPT